MINPFFIGKWNWTYTDHDFGWCDNQSFFEVLTPITENTTFSLEFIEKGKVLFYKNANFLSEYRVKFKAFEGPNDVHCTLYDGFWFNIDLNNVKEQNFNGCINTDTILLVSFPDFIFQTISGCETHVNYFVKE